MDSLTEAAPRRPGDARPPARPDRGRLARTAGLIGAVTLIGQALGVVRDQLFAALLGASLLSDALVVALRLPTLVRDLFAQGVLAAGLVPAFAGAAARGSREAAHVLANRAVGALLLAGGALVLAGSLWPAPIVAALAPGLPPPAAAAAALLTRIALPGALLVAVAAVFMARLNAEERFAAPALAPAAFNLTTVAAAVLLAAAGRPEREILIGWAAATLAGAAAQLLVQAPALRRIGYRPRPAVALADPELRRVARAVALVTIALAAPQINLLVATWFASRDAGANTWLTYAFRLFSLPVVLVGVPVATVAGVGLARDAAAGDAGALRARLRDALALVVTLAVPATLGLIILGGPITRLLFEHGRFTPADTASTAGALTFYALGLVPHCAARTLAPAFFAQSRYTVPALAAAAAVAVNLAVSALLVRPLGFRALALGAAAGALVNAAVLAAACGRAHGGLARGLAPLLLRVAAATAVAAAAAQAAALLAAPRLPADLGGQVAAVLAPALVGSAVYVAVGRLLRRREGP